MHRFLKLFTAIVFGLVFATHAHAFTLKKTLTKGEFTYQGVTVNPAPLANAYKANRHKGFWTSKKGLFGINRNFTKDGNALLQTVAAIGNEGLVPSDYLSPELAGLKKLPLKELDQIELYMTAGFLKLARDLHVGVIGKASLPEDIVKADKNFDPNAVLESLRKNGLKRTLSILRPQHPQYDALRKAMERTNDPAQRQIIAANMERWRWLPQDLGKNHILVNQPAYKMFIFKDGRIADERKVIIGKTEFATPQFSHKMSYVEFNPEWNVPPSIAVREYLPKLLKNSNYLKRVGYTIYDGWGAKAKELDGRKIKWSKIDKDNPNRFPYRIVQGSGPKNALGKVKFMFPNDFDIYLHDTPAKKLFKSENRAFSHGCIRVHNPLDFAKKVFEISGGLSPAKIDGLIKKGDRTQVRLKNKMPVHLSYFTAWAETGGNVSFLTDVYNRDRAIFAQLR